MEVDRISNLPDELLCHILSSLPTKLAFTTTILSKRWTSLFYSLDVLRIDRNNFWNEDATTFHRFCRFVDNLLLSTNKPLKTLHLDYHFGCCEEDRNSNILKTWLEASIRRRVQKLHLTLYWSQSLNPNFLICSTHTYLKLKVLKFASDTSCVDLPSLKTLHLTSVLFTNRNDYINFLSGCPNLEDLHSKRIYYEKHEENNAPEEEGLYSFTLSKLVRAKIGSINFMFNVIKNVKFLRIVEEDPFKVIPVFQNLIHIELVCRGYLLDLLLG